MSQSYEININNQVVPYASGKINTDTSSWRDATELELQQKRQIEDLELKIKELESELDQLRSEENC